MADPYQVNDGNTQRMNVAKINLMLRMGLLSGAALLALVSLPGCAATDGGIPVGSTKAVLSGQVVRALAPHQPVANAQLTLAASDGSGYTGTTDATGTYYFPDVPSGPGTLQVLPPAGSDLAPQTLTVDVAPDSTLSIAAALAPASVYAAAAGVTLAPAALTLTVGQTAAVTAVIQGTGIPGGIIPSLTVYGGVGHVFPNQSFTATHVGAGFIVAAFGGHQASARVTVQP
jgi:hypothetical protein